MDEDGLFAAPLEGFIRERDALARDLRAQGRTEEAARVKALRKPSPTAWAVNQVARRHPEDLTRLFEAGDRVVGAHRPGAGGLHEAMAGQRKLVAALTEQAAEILREAGHAVSPATRERVAGTLTAAASDPRARDAVGAGRLTADLGPVGFEALTGLAPAPSEAPAEGRAAARERERRRKDLARRAERLAARAEEAEAQARELSDEAARAEEEAERARRAAQEAVRAARQARGEADEATAAAEDA